MAVTWAGTTSCLKRKFLKCIVQCYVFFQSPPGRHPMINILSTICTPYNLCKNFSLAILFGSNSKSYTVSRQLDMCVYTHVLHNMEMLVG